MSIETLAAIHELYLAWKGASNIHDTLTESELQTIIACAPLTTSLLEEINQEFQRLPRPKGMPPQSSLDQNPVTTLAEKFQDDQELADFFNFVTSYWGEQSTAGSKRFEQLLIGAQETERSPKFVTSLFLSWYQDYPQEAVSYYEHKKNEEHRHARTAQLPPNALEGSDDGKKLLELAAHFNDALLLEMLLQQKIYTQEAIDSAFNIAIDMGHINSMNVFITQRGNNKPAQLFVCFALIWAVDNKQIEVVEKILAATGDNIISQVGVGKVLKSATQNRWVNVINEILAMTGDNKLSQQDVGEALVWAARYGLIEVVEKLLAMTGYNRPSQQDVGWALNDAAMYRHISVVKKILAMTGYNQPSQQDVVKVLTHAAIDRQIDLVEKILAMTGYNKPSQQDVGEALISAAKNEQIAVIEKILAMTGDNKPSQYYVGKALFWADRKGLIAVVEKILAMTGDNKPSQQDVRDALSSAAKNGQIEVIEKILAMTGDNQPSQYYVGKTLIEAMENNRTVVIKKILSVIGHNKFSQEKVGEVLSWAKEKEHVTVEDLQKYLQLIAIDTSQFFDKLSILFKILEIFAKKKPYNEELIKIILDDILSYITSENVSIIDAVPDELKKERQIIPSQIIHAYVKEREQQFDTLIAKAQTLEQTTLVELEDACNKHLAQINVLMQLTLQKNFKYSNQYYLKASLASTLLDNRKTDINTVITILCPSKMDSSLRKRMLVTLYAACKNEEHRHAITAQLPPNALEGSYDGKKLFELATHFNNVPLLQMLLQQKIYSQEEIDSAINIATDMGHIDAMGAFITQQANNKHCRQYVGEVLNSAAKHGHNAVIEKMLAMTGINQPSQQDVRYALNSAAENGQIAVVKQILAMTGNNKPSQQNVMDALNSAAENEQIAVVEQILAMTGDNKPSQKSVGGVLCWAYKKRHISVAEKILAMTGDNQASQYYVGWALKKHAADNKHISVAEKILAMTGDNKPSQQDVRDALNSAVENERIAVIEKILAMTGDNKPSQQNVGWALNSAAKHGHIAVVEKILTMTGDNRPSQLDVKAVLFNANAVNNSYVTRTITSIQQTHQKRYLGNELYNKINDQIKTLDREKNGFFSNTSRKCAKIDALKALLEAASEPSSELFSVAWEAYKSNNAMEYKQAMLGVFSQRTKNLLDQVDKLTSKRANIIRGPGQVPK